VSTKILINELLDFVDDVADDLGSRHRLKFVETILEKGTGADRQLAVYNKTKSLVDVAEYIQSQFLCGV
jgi:carboxylate-amine ligase